MALDILRDAPVRFDRYDFGGGKAFDDRLGVLPPDIVTVNRFLHKNPLEIYFHPASIPYPLTSCFWLEVGGSKEDLPARFRLVLLTFLFSTFRLTDILLATRLPASCDSKIS